MSPFQLWSYLYGFNNPAAQEVTNRLAEDDRRRAFNSRPVPLPPQYATPGAPPPPGPDHNYDPRNQAPVQLRPGNVLSRPNSAIDQDWSGRTQYPNESLGEILARNIGSGANAPEVRALREEADREIQPFVHMAEGARDDAVRAQILRDMNAARGSPEQVLAQLFGGSPTATATPRPQIAPPSLSPRPVPVVPYQPQELAVPNNQMPAFIPPQQPINPTPIPANAPPRPMSGGAGAPRYPFGAGPNSLGLTIGESLAPVPAPVTPRLPIQGPQPVAPTPRPRPAIAPRPVPRAAPQTADELNRLELQRFLAANPNGPAPSAPSAPVVPPTPGIPPNQPALPGVSPPNSAVGLIPKSANQKIPEVLKDQLVHEALRLSRLRRNGGM